jgi:hypothetical protein
MSTKSYDGGGLIPVNIWSTVYEWPSEAELRDLILHRKENGFDRVIVQIGRRMLIDEVAFLDWARAQGRPFCEGCGKPLP